MMIHYYLVLCATKLERIPFMDITLNCKIRQKEHKEVKHKTMKIKPYQKASPVRLQE